MASSYNSKLSNVLFNYLTLLKVPVTQLGISKLLRQHYDYPSLLSISETLAKYKIGVEAYTLEEKHIDEMQPPLLTMCKNLPTGKDFVLVTKITNTTISYTSESNRKENISREDFIKDWKNIVVIAEPTPNSVEPNYKENKLLEEKSKSKRFFLSVALIISFLSLALPLLIYTPLLITSILILSTKIIGTAIAILLITFELDKSNYFVQKLCSTGKQTNCNAVLNSNASGIFGIKWSEAGLFYFTSTLLFLLFPNTNFSFKIAWLSLTAIIVSPYIVFSIFYQYKVVKQWCKLCLATQAILFTELIWAIQTFWKNEAPLNFSMPIIYSFIISILIPVIIWYFIKPYLQNNNESKSIEENYKRIIYNPDYFYQLLQTQPSASAGWENIGINIGNPNAENTIIKVCNPYCSPCALVHPILEELINKNPRYNLKIIFTSTNKEEDIGNKPVKLLLAIASNNEQEIVQKALDDWYNAENKDYETFAKVYPMNGEIEFQKDKIEMMNKWCQETGISHTPTIYINGKQLPDNYTVNELKNIL